MVAARLGFMAHFSAGDFGGRGLILGGDRNGRRTLGAPAAPKVQEHLPVEGLDTAPELTCDGRVASARLDAFRRLALDNALAEIARQLDGAEVRMLLLKGRQIGTAKEQGGSRHGREMSTREYSRY